MTPGPRIPRIPRILVAGIGNIFLGDDAFGVEVARRLMARSLPEGVRVVDFGIRGIDLTYALIDGCNAAILIDAVPRGGAPGTLYVIEPDLNDSAPPDPQDALIDPHSMDPAKVLRVVRAMGGRLDRILLVGCEPTPPRQGGDDEEMQMTLSLPVQAAVEEAANLVESLVRRMLAGTPSLQPQPAAAQPEI